MPPASRDSAEDDGGGAGTGREPRSHGQSGNAGWQGRGTGGGGPARAYPRDLAAVADLDDFRDDLDAAERVLLIR